MWFVLGLFVGLAQLASLYYTVGHLEPHPQARHLGPLALRTWSLLLGGYLFRLGLVALALLVAVQRGPRPALWLFGGFWLARWIPVYLAGTDRLDWTRFD